MVVAGERAENWWWSSSIHSLLYSQTEQSRAQNRESRESEQNKVKNRWPMCDLIVQPPKPLAGWSKIDLNGFTYCIFSDILLHPLNLLVFRIAWKRADDFEPGG